MQFKMSEKKACAGAHAFFSFQMGYEAIN